MKILLGIGLMILGVILGLYLGVWWGFIGGIIQLIESVTPVIIPMGIAFGIARIFVLSSLLGWLSFIVLFGIGTGIVNDEF